MKKSRGHQLYKYDSIEEYFRPGGTIARNLRDYEERPGQGEMASAVFGALSDSRHALIEAPCGIGKSYAYIIPAALYAQSTGEKVVISTNTKTLQEQLKASDLPTISHHYGLNVRYKILKGKSNYICLRKLYDIKKSGIPLDLFGEYAAEKIKLRTDIYLDAMNEIDRKDIAEFEELSHEASPDINFQRLIACQSVDCVGGNCEYFKNCNYFRSILEAQKSEIIVVNHALYFACLMIEANEKLDALSAFGAGEDDETKNQQEKAFLNPIPSHSRVIFDEAHHIADVAQSGFSMSCSLHKFNSTLNTITYALKKNVGKKAKTVTDKIAEQKYLVEERIKLYFNHVGMSLLDDFLSKKAEEGGGGSAVDDNGAASGLSKLILFNGNHLGRIAGNPNSDNLISALETLSETANEIGELLVEKKLPLNITGINRMISEMVTATDLWSNAKSLSEEYILWGSLPFQSARNNNYSDVEMIASPLDVSKIIESELFSKKKSVILTSATLSTENNFNYIKGEVGLSKFAPIEIMLDSPFNIEEQTGFIIPPIEATPKDRNFNEAVSRWVQDIILKSDGRTLVLFTSRYLMEYVYREVGMKLKLDGYEVLIQGQMPRGTLLNKFKKDVRSSLFALDSFWEGIDVRGESLSTLIITKLPFKVPSHPLNEARDLYLKKQNRDPFSESSLPWTMLKLKQGIGRLIRHQSDRGALVILDTRLRDTSYGRKISAALPKYHKLKNIAEIKVFLENNE